MMAGIAQDYDCFYQQEIQFRRELQYPPFSKFLKLTISGGDEAMTMKSAENTAAILQQQLETSPVPVDILGPYAAPVAKIGDIFRVQLLLRANDLTVAKRILVDSGIAGSTAITIDVDPLGMM